jgi:protein-arginine kinase activator protein McsA
MGCEECYKVFTPEVEQAMRQLHGVEPPSDNPWPTKRAKNMLTPPSEKFV